MLRLPDTTLGLSATDLTNHLACAHLTEQRRLLALGQRAKWRVSESPHADLVRERGDAYEQEQLARLSSELGGHVEITDRPPFSEDELRASAAETLDAMRCGAPLIYQAVFFDGRWQGKTDFLRRIAVDRPSLLGDFAYEVIDAKLSRQLRPHVVHQVSLYSRLLAEAQGHAPEDAFVLLGDGSEQRVELRRFAALHRHVTRRLELLLDQGPRDTYPEPTSHCAICALFDECEARLREDDHLSFVANLRRDQRELLVDHDVPTLTALAHAGPDAAPKKMGETRFALHHHQASLQLESRRSGAPTRRHLEPERARGYALLPPASPGDVFFDLEGDPYAAKEGGIEYLWGWVTADRGYECVWSHDVAAERGALELFVDLVQQRRQQWPDLHVYHYAPHEASKLRSLALEYATREEDVDDLLRSRVLVDLFAVVRQGLQVGEESYSLKRLERHHGFVRLEKSVREGGGSVVAYEDWLKTGEEELLEAIRAYNGEDCRSTLALRDWLLGDLVREAEQQYAVDFRELAEPAPEEPREAPAWMEAHLELVARVNAGLPVDPALDTPDEAERRLLGHLLMYHYRESKPEWWRHFELRKLSAIDLIDERDAIGGLEPAAGFDPVLVKQSLQYAFRFPPQEFKLDLGRAEDPVSKTGVKIVAIEGDQVTVSQRASKPPPQITALVGGSPIDAAPLRGALAVVAESVIAQGDEYAAARSIMRRDPPRCVGGFSPQDGDVELDAMIATALDLDHGCLAVQGPPGTGKTYRGARMIVAAIDAGHRVAVTAPSHAAIHNMLRAVEDHAQELGVELTGVYKGDGYESPHGLIEQVDDNQSCCGEHNLVAGTAWLLCRDEHRSAFRLLFIDEAGQFALANAIACAPAADSVVLLGDPQQLPQVTKAPHPGGAGASVLEHLLDGAATMPPDRGYLLTESWRMHPGVCAFISERSYDGRLRSRDACSTRDIAAPKGALAGTGLRVVDVEHQGRSQSSPEEATVIAQACRELLDGGAVTDDAGATRALEPADIVVVAPYNLAVRAIAAVVPAGVRVGTVDRFQGQEAPVVFYAMTCSSGEDVPRGLDFLFSQNRMNVAISRAQCLAVLVASPRLLDADCRSVEAMALLDGACRFAEMAT